jgi:membrane protein CcdC involved in cytochrome C biogenesis
MNETVVRLLPLIIPLAVMALFMRRAVRGRKVRVERLWIMPAIAVLAGGAVIAMQPPLSPLALGIQLFAMVLGSALGWYRGAFTRLSVDAETHEVTSKASAAGIILVLVAFFVRYATRSFMGQQGSALHLNAGLITDAFVLFAIGMIVVQRLEMWLRCRRLLAKARADKAANVTR